VYHTIKIEGYRGLDRFEMGNLGRVNLLVGRNNSGKTSVLEALHLLSYGGDITALWQLCGRRGERFGDERDLRYGPDSEIDISHMFAGHEPAIGSKFAISARNQTPERTVTFEITERPKQERGEQVPVTTAEEGVLRPRLALRILATAPTPSRSITLSPRGGINYEFVDTTRRPGAGRPPQAVLPTSHLISTDSLNASELTRLWDRIQLTPQEGLVLEALKFIDPEIQQIRATGAARLYGDRGGFIIKRSDYRQPFPLGSLGDGAWRMLAMAIVLTQCTNGVLLIDEIDTGLHYTVMSDMWKLIFNAAKEFNVQVFATTHSYDCVHSLATICQSEVTDNSQVTIQRIDPRRKKAVPFTEAEIKIAAERQIEVR
jgi:predicted ATPase